MAIYPPTGSFYQRGEDRCQINVESSAANSLRACNDLGYISAILKRDGYSVIIKDYQAEKKQFSDLICDVKKENPDVVFISTANGCIHQDLQVVSTLKSINPNLVIVMKSALFFNCEKSLFENIDFIDVDYLVGGEIEFIISDLIDAHYNDKEKLKIIEGISYKINDEWITNNLINFNEDLDLLPFPDRKEIKNELYINPETNRPMALITTSKGCCFSCKYCLSPIISGKKIRERSVESIFAEIEECVNEHNIVDFFFKADTFSTNKKSVMQLCEMLIEKGYNKKINWVSTTRVDAVDDEMLKTMKKAGCSLVAMGFESGSNESLKKMGKNTTVEKNLEAAKLCKKNGLKILGHFLIGFPWETTEHLKEVKKHIFDVDADYIEISILVPYIGTPIHDEYLERVGSDINVFGSDSFGNVFKNFAQLSAEQLQKFRKNTLIRFYLRPKYIFKKLMSVRSVGTFSNYIKYGFRMLKNSLF